VFYKKYAPKKEVIQVPVLIRHRAPYKLLSLTALQTKKEGAGTPSSFSPAASLKHSETSRRAMSERMAL
jgi:hypothetical protein